ncbi:DUF2867 domain-containing protein [Streptomyces sp. A3M-1-3]|uniref:DUF2867 domain-containing protein n=1 Tax=Streptomyces sp. A3M-1-3 TaxID=2962044 RepID=UPI0020B71275|nr:DUF2867 domain-containing protein [Streptomyces sp. A3M-1-3]MCP3819082.1 DUF2867 domain-containing protein [Streptomyces sp. A3M-1-3]
MSTVRNVHERTIGAPAEAVGALLDRLSSDDDPVWPSPAWPPMRFDRPLGVGAVGGHGFVRYSVTAYEPGRLVRFDFADSDGFHQMQIEPLGPDRCRVVHVLQEKQGPAARLAWELAIRPLHDVVVEEVFDNIERLATGGPARPTRWSPWVRLLHRLVWDRPKAADIPADALLVRTAFDRPDFSDAWRLPLVPGMPADPAAWEHVLPFPVVAREGAEIMLGEDAGHLDFRASVFVGREEVTLSTVVRTHNRLGRLYFAVVRRAHPFMARAMLRRTHRRLALAAPGAAERTATTSA